MTSATVTAPTTSSTSARTEWRARGAPYYRPKPSSQDLLLEARANLLRLKQEIPLTDDECAAVEDGLAALVRLCANLADVPTPAGPTPRQLGSGGRLELPVLPADTPNGAATSGGTRLEQSATQC